MSVLAFANARDGQDPYGKDKKYRGRDSHDFLIHFEPATFGDFILSGFRILADYESRPRRRSRRNGPSYATPATSTVLGKYVIFCFPVAGTWVRSTDPFENCSTRHSRIL